MANVTDEIMAHLEGLSDLDTRDALELIEQWASARSSAIQFNIHGNTVDERRALEVATLIAEQLADEYT